MNFTYAYLRASTKEQDANRAREQLEKFATDNGQRIAAFFTENASGAMLHRPELMRLLDNTQPSDNILVESIDRLSRMHPDDWDKLKRMIQDRGLNIVAIDLPTTHSILKNSDLFTSAILKSINQLIIDILAVLSHKDYVQRRERQRQGIEKAKKNGKYLGRRKMVEKYEAIIKMSQLGLSISDISNTLGVSPSTVSRARKEALKNDVQTSIFEHIRKQR